MNRAIRAQDLSRVYRALQELSATALPGPNGEPPAVESITVERTCTGRIVRFEVVLNQLPVVVE